MSNILATMSSAGNALDVFEKALTITQNNINNASTTGYARQEVNLESLELDVSNGLAGGVESGDTINTRDTYAEETLQQATQLLSYYTAQANSTSTVQSYFDVTGTSGVSTALSNLFTAFSSWATTPSSTTTQDNVIAAAKSLASAINSLASSLKSEASSLDSSISSSVDQINTVEDQIQSYNQEKLKEAGTSDSTLDAQLYSSLDTLSGYVNFSTVTNSDGTVSVLLSDGTPLVEGTTVNHLSEQTAVTTDPTPTYADSEPTAHILDSSGNDVTSEITSGKLGGQLDTRNRVLASILGDSQQQGSLNELAQTLADSVNTILESGTVSTTTGAASGSALFTYDTTNLASVASTLAVSSTITGSELAAVDSSGNSNGNAETLANLASATSGTGTIGGLSLVKYYAKIASDVGSENTTATDNETSQTDVVSTATSLVSSVSGVSLNTEAVAVTQFQQAYEAASQVLTVLDKLCETVIALIQT